MEARKVRFKILVLGDFGVGKTSFEAYIGKIKSASSIHRSGGVYGEFRSTTGASFSVVDMNVKEFRIILLFWVISDEPGFDHIYRAFFSDSKAAILLYDITNASSINRLTEWCHMISEYCGEIPSVLAGNKLDIEKKRAISKEEGLAFQREHNLTMFMEVSMKTGEGVYEMLEFLRDILLEKFFAI